MLQSITPCLCNFWPSGSWRNPVGARLRNLCSCIQALVYQNKPPRDLKIRESRWALPHAGEATVLLHLPLLVWRDASPVLFFFYNSHTGWHFTATCIICYGVLKILRCCYDAFAMMAAMCCNVAGRLTTACAVLCVMTLFCHLISILNISTCCVSLLYLTKHYVQKLKINHYYSLHTQLIDVLDTTSFLETRYSKFRSVKI